MTARADQSGKSAGKTKTAKAKIKRTMINIIT